MKIRFNSNTGFSLPELVVVMAVSSMAMYGMMSVMVSVFHQQKVYESKAESRAHQLVMEKVIQKSITVVRPELFAANRGFVYDASAVTSANPMAISGTMVPPYVEQITINTIPAKTEPGTPFDGLIGVIPNTFSFQLDSFSLAVMKVEIDSATKKLNGEVSRLFISRCIRNLSNNIGENGEVTDNRSPGKSTLRLLKETVQPFIVNDGGQLTVRCCPYNPNPLLSPNCQVENKYPNYIPKIFMVTLDNNIPTSVVEYPQPRTRESVGAAFMLTFNSANSPSYFRLMYVDLENTCQTSYKSRMYCSGRNPANYLGGGKAIELGTAFSSTVIQTRDFVRFGRVKKGFDTSGVILLGE